MARKTVKKASAKTSKRRAPAKRTQAKRTAPKRATSRAVAQPQARGKLKLSMLTGSYEIVRALKDGAIQPKGI